MRWRDLTDNAKSVLEWTESPYTGRLCRITIEADRPFVRLGAPVLQFVSRQLFDEIVTYLKGREGTRLFGFQETGSGRVDVWVVEGH